MPSYRRLQQAALLISVISIFYNGAEGAISIAFGADSGSRSLVFFGVQSGIEVISACIVVWRFSKVAKPGEEKGLVLGARELRIEKIATYGIGSLLMGLAIATEITAIVSLVKHDKPDSSNASLIISASALVIMIFIWLPKRYLARTLDSSAMKGEAACSRACILITGVLFIGSLIFRLWSNGWWVDSATSLVLGLLFGRDGVEMLQWARDPDFNGGCCGSCANTKIEHDAELGEQYRDICSCCSEKEECKNADSCQCDMNSIAHSDGDKCCKSISEQTNVCCTREFIKKQKAVTDSDTDSCCGDKGSHETPPTSTSNTRTDSGDDCGKPCCAAEISTVKTTEYSIGNQKGGCKSGCCD